MRLSNAQRDRLKAVITRHPGWPDYRAENGGIRSSDLGLIGKPTVYDAAMALGIDVDAVLGDDFAARKAAVWNGGGVTKAAAAPREDDGPVIAEAAPRDDDLTAIVKAAVAEGIAEYLRAKEAAKNAPREAKVPELRHQEFDTLADMVYVRNASGHVPNIFLFGPRGTGKSQAARQVADMLGLSFFQHGVLNLAHEILGYRDPLKDGEYHETPFIRAYRDGGVCLLDEQDRWDANGVTALNGPLADGELHLNNGKVIKRHRDCIIIATGNTRGQGADRKYTGANRLDAAYLDRFPQQIEWTLDLTLEAKLIGNEEVRKHVMKVRRVIGLNALDCEITTRQAIAMADMIRSGRFTLERAAKHTYVPTFTAEQLEVIANA